MEDIIITSARHSLQQQRKHLSREQLLTAAANAFCDFGYFNVSVEDIAAAAGVSRMTFYRHFSGKADLALDLFRKNAKAWMPRFLAIAKQDWSKRSVVAGWLTDLFEADRQSSQLLRVFIQANAEESGFSKSAQGLMAELIVELGKSIPAFLLDREVPTDERRWIEAWLLIYEILDLSNHAARRSGIAENPYVIEILADRFVQFIAGSPASSSAEK